MKQFWLVWNPNNGIPKMKHDTKQEAFEEAARLGGLYPLYQFYVLEFKGHFGPTAATWHEATT